MGNNFRQGVIAVFMNKLGQLLVCKRHNQRAWQFPQGGIEFGEAEDEALSREVFEEIGVKDFRILSKSKDKTNYKFPPNMKRSENDYIGQEHRWFLCELGEGVLPDLETATDHEFDEWRWISPKQSISHVIPWKRKSYIQGLKMLGVIDE